MFCGTSKAKVSNDNGLIWVNKMREVQNKTIKADLGNGCCLGYKNEDGKWRYMSKSDLSQMTEEQRKEYKEELSQQLHEKDEECNAIEKKYLARLVKFCFMVQMHCELKKQTTQEFKKHGFDVSELEEYEKDDSYY